jgi:hypothetical protein
MDEREGARQAAVEREIAKWKAKEVERLDKRRRENKTCLSTPVGLGICLEPLGHNLEDTVQRAHLPSTLDRQRTILFRLMRE